MLKHAALILLLWMPYALPAEEPVTILRASRALDGRGGVMSEVDIVIRGERIASVGTSGAPPSDAALLDLRGLTLLPGLIDTHVHIGAHFDDDGRAHSSASSDTSGQIAARGTENALRTLLGGVTTVQSLGAPSDADLRRAVERGLVPGPRVLTSLASIADPNVPPDALRQAVRERAGEGADLIKIFASASIRDGGAPTLSQEQLDALCSEARAAGLRGVVHAHAPEAARRAVRAGCTTIEHGALLDRSTLELMAEHGTYYDPNIDLIFRNYFENKPRFLGIGNYTEEGFAHMERAVPRALEVFREALSVPRLKVLFGTDAVAGAHGRNVEELIYRVRQGGQAPSDAIVAATSLAAESLGLASEIGALAPDFAADVIGVEGNPLEDIETLKRVRLVMRAGKIYKMERSTRGTE
jgi:imidazolonepropionase-like amidohydrolase